MADMEYIKSLVLVPEGIEIKGPQSYYDEIEIAAYYNGEKIAYSHYVLNDTPDKSFCLKLFYVKPEYRSVFPDLAFKLIMLSFIKTNSNLLTVEDFTPSGLAFFKKWEKINCWKVNENAKKIYLNVKF